MTDEEIKLNYPIQYQEGYETCENRKGNIDYYINPYSPGNYFHDAWAIGWSDAWEKLQEKGIVP